jgi:hypothetical protein
LGKYLQKLVTRRVCLVQISGGSVANTFMVIAKVTKQVLSATFPSAKGNCLQKGSEKK